MGLYGDEQGCIQFMFPKMRGPFVGFQVRIYSWDDIGAAQFYGSATCLRGLTCSTSWKKCTANSIRQLNCPKKLNQGRFPTKPYQTWLIPASLNIIADAETEIPLQHSNPCKERVCKSNCMQPIAAAVHLPTNLVPVKCTAPKRITQLQQSTAHICKCRNLLPHLFPANPPGTLS